MHAGWGGAVLFWIQEARLVSGEGGFHQRCMGKISIPSGLYDQTSKSTAWKTSRQMDCTANTPVCSAPGMITPPDLFSYSQKECGIRKPKPFMVFFGAFLLNFTPLCLGRLTFVFHTNVIFPLTSLT